MSSTRRYWEEKDTEMCDTAGVDNLDFAQLHERLCYLHQIMLDYEQNRTDWCIRHAGNVLYSLNVFNHALGKLYEGNMGINWMTGRTP